MTIGVDDPPEIDDEPRGMVIDHLDFDGAHRALVHLACADAERVFLRALDKGLSGSSVWLAEWNLPGGARSKPHVLKIGPHQKLTTEEHAVRTVASVIDVGFPQVNLFTASGNAELALLRQEFLGGPEPLSLRHWLADPGRNCTDAQEMVELLFRERLGRWHFVDKPPAAVDRRPLGEALAAYTRHLDWNAAIDEVGPAAVEMTLEREGWSTAGLRTALEDMLADQETIALGVAHGDLHAQNVLVSVSGELYLIDFGRTALDLWRAVDFLMLECSLKFVVAPQHVDVEVLMNVDRLLDDHVEPTADVVLQRFHDAPYGARLSVVAAAVAEVRRAARRANAVTGTAQYRRGLLAMTAGMMTLPGGVNRVYLLRSLAYHMSHTHLANA